MPFIPAGYCNVQFVMLDSTNNHEYLTAIGAQLEAADGDEVVEDFSNAFWTRFGPYIPNECSELLTRLTLGTSVPSAPLIFEFSGEHVGSSSGASLPPNTCYLIQKRTASGGRKNRGRMFLPKPSAAAIGENGAISSSQLLALAGAAGNFLTDCEAITGVTNCYVLHSSSVDTPTQITSLVPDANIATQRRRLR